MPPSPPSPPTHRLLLRQLRTALGIADPAALERAFAELDRLADDNDGLSAEARGVLRGLPRFIAQADAAHYQADRDLELAKRSLEISSGELIESNDRLQKAVGYREDAMTALRETTNRLLAPLGRRVDAEDGLHMVARHLDELIADLLRTRQDLQNRQFALDQHAIVSITDAAGRITYANDRFCEISGYTQAELLGQNHRIVNSGLHPPEVFRQMWETIASGRVWHGEIRNRKRSGSFYWVAATIVPILDAAGIPMEYISIRTDISQQKALEENMQRAQRFLQEVMDTLGEGVYTLDADGNCTFLNREAETLLGWAAAEVRGCNLHDLVHFQTEDGTPVSRDDCPTHRSIRDGKVYRSDEDAFTCKDGRIIPVSVVAAPLMDGGRVIGTVAAFQNITARRQAAAELMRAKESAESANRAKSDFLATMSHEIRTPMNGIIGMTELALDTELTADQREYLLLVKTSADQLLDIVNDILDFSKIEAGRMDLERIAFGVQELVATALRPLSIRAYQKGLEISYELSPDVPESVIGDPGRLRQVLVNLVGNAIKFSAQGEISVRIARLRQESDGSVVLDFQVADQGIGIPPEMHAHIFDAFAQADTSTTRKYGGTGLGLAISRRIVEAMGGEIGVDSAPGQGSRFHFTARFAADASIPVPPSMPQDLTGISVLVVDDHDTNLRLLFQLLTKWGMTVTAVRSGAEAMDAIRTAEKMDAPFRFALLDMMMPGMDGFETAEEIVRGLNADHTEILMLTSGGIRGDGERCRQLGISAYLTKPVVADELLASLQSLLTPADRTRPLITRHSIAEANSTPSRRILVAEDNPTNQILARAVLEKWGHRVVMVGTGQDAVARSARETFDLILMDMRMPGMDGLEATRAIRERERPDGRHTPIVAMTANALESDRQLCLDAGMDAFLTKPLESARLQATIDGLAAAADAAVERFDYDAALRRSDPWVIGVVAEPFQADWPVEFAQLETALAGGDAATAARVAHTLKGLAANFAAQPVVDAARTIEHAAKDGALEGLAQYIPALHEGLTALDRALAQFIRENPPAAD